MILRRPSILVIFACLTMLGLQGWIEWEARVAQVQETKAALENLSRSLAQDTENTIEVADTAVDSVVARLETGGTASDAVAQIDRELKVQASDVTRFRAVIVMGPDGNWLASSVPGKAPGGFDRAYFQHHRNDPAREAFIGPPIKNRIDGHWSITVSRRFDAAGGGFGGIVLALIDLSYFTGHFASFDLGRNSSITLFAANGTLLARVPQNEQNIGRNFSQGAIFDRLAGPLGGSFLNTALTDGIRRYVGYRRSEHYPFVVVAGMWEDQALGEWRTEMRTHMLVAAVLTAAIGLLGLHLLRQIARSSEAEERVRESEARYRQQAETLQEANERVLLATDSGGIGLWEWNVAKNTVIWDAWMYRLHGIRLGEDPSYKVWQQHVHPDDRAKAAQAVRDALRARSSEVDATSDVNRPLKQTDSRARSSEVDATSDVNRPLKQTDSRARSSEVDATSDVNRPLKQTGLARDSVGLRLSRANGGTPYASEFRVIWGDGSIHYIRASGQVTRDEAGNVTRIIGANWDITDQRVGEEQRAIIIEAAPNGMMIVDEAGLITLANTQTEKLFGYPPGELVGQPVEILVSDEFRVAHGMLRSAFTSAQSDRGMTAGREFIGRKRDGSPVTVEIMLSPVKTPRGRITVVAIIDATERRRLAAEQLEAEKRERLAVEETNASLSRLSRHLTKARDEAVQANRAKSRFLAGMSHELRTPLNGILGYAQLLHIDGGLNPTQTERVGAMLQAGKHLLEMITCVLDLSEIEAEHVAVQAVEFDVRALAEACVDLVRPAASAKGLALSLDTATDLPPSMVGDSVRLRQILLNLLGNAVKFTSQGAVTLRLRAMADGATLRIVVADTGPGIQIDQRRRLFQDFERLGTEATRSVEGAGLGLALSARLATLLGGQLGYDDNPGGGSVFWLELPSGAAATHVPAAAPAFERRDAQPAARALHVLVVDDVLINRDIASSFLRAAGHEASCAEDGAEAVAAVAGSDFDVVLMDVRMPLMDGLEATRRIRALEGARGRVPIVALTAQAFADQVAACREAGMDSHLGKPFEIDTLLAAVAQAVGSRQRPEVNLELKEPPIDVTAALIHQQLPVLDPSVFERTASSLTPEIVASHMRTISELAETILNGLSKLDLLLHPSGTFVDTAHTLTGSAGMFGFTRLAATGRNFERAMRTGAAETPALAARLYSAVEATLEEIARCSLKHPVR